MERPTLTNPSTTLAGCGGGFWEGGVGWPTQQFAMGISPLCPSRRYRYPTQIPSPSSETAENTTHQSSALDAQRVNATTPLSCRTLISNMAEEEGGWFDKETPPRVHTTTTRAQSW